MSVVGYRVVLIGPLSERMTFEGMIEVDGAPFGVEGRMKVWRICVPIEMGASTRGQEAILEVLECGLPIEGMEPQHEIERLKRRVAELERRGR